MPAKPPIPTVLSNLPARAHAEVPSLVPFKPGLPYQTMILGRTADGYIDDIVADAESLKIAGWIEGYAKSPRNDGYGFYVSILINQSQALEIKNTNDGYRLFERGHVKAMTKASLPAWASNDGEPTHVFWGREMPEDDGYGN